VIAGGKGAKVRVSCEGGQRVRERIPNRMRNHCEGREAGTKHEWEFSYFCFVFISPLVLFTARKDWQVLCLYRGFIFSISSPWNPPFSPLLSCQSMPCHCLSPSRCRECQDSCFSLPRLRHVTRASIRLASPMSRNETDRVGASGSKH